jgi:acyl-CoA synthetase (NDP forming)
LTDIVKQLDYIFKPRSIAVIGASDNITKWGYMMVDRPLRTGYKGTIYPVNPRKETILGLHCYPTIKDIPGNIDLAVITVPSMQIPQQMRDCADKGVKGTIIISAGFAEIGSEGKQLEDEVITIAKKGGIRCVGPNCTGITSAASNLNLVFNEQPKAGHIAFLSQSGTFGGYMAEMADNKEGYGLRMFVSVGNQADLTFADYIEYLQYDDQTKAIVLYLEGVKNGKRFFNVTSEIIKRKPVILYKGGSSSAGARATMSHTASIAGSDNIFQNACRQIGLIKTQEAFQIFEIAVALMNQPLPTGRRIGILGTGGQGVVTSDACSNLGLEVPELDRDTSLKIMKMLPPHAPMPRNPVDFAGGYRSAIDEINVVETLMKLDYIDGIIRNLPINPAVWGLRFDPASDLESIQKSNKIVMEGAKILAALPWKYNKPIICIRWNSNIIKDPLGDFLAKAGIPSYETPEQCARAMHALFNYAEIRRRKNI